MSDEGVVYILGSGAIGFPLAAYLAHAGKRVVAVRTSRRGIPRGTAAVAARGAAQTVRAVVETASLSELSSLRGTIVVATKSHANAALAQELTRRATAGPIVILQNGVGVERPFLDGPFAQVYRCVLYITSQAVAEYEFTVRPVSASPIGAVRGDEATLAECVRELSTEGFPFRAEANIEREVWKKAIANAVFNSICPLLDADNGIFVRDEAAAALAREVVGECVALTDRLGLGLGERELMDQILLISRRSDGQLISTLQDIRAGRRTEIDVLNLAIAATAAALEPSLALPKTELLGKLIAAKSALGRSDAR